MRRLLSKDLDREGTEVIAALNDADIDSHIVQTEKRVILDSMAASAKNKATYRDLFTGGKTQHFRRMLIGASSQLMQQIGGYVVPLLCGMDGPRGLTWIAAMPSYTTFRSCSRNPSARLAI